MAGGVLESRKVERIKNGLRLSLIISVLASLTLIVITVDEDTFEHLLYIKPWYLVLALFLSLFIWWVGGLKLCIMARTLDESLSMKEGIRAFLVGSFASGVTPFASGGGPVMVYMIHQQNISVGRATTMVLVQSVLRIILLGLFSAYFYFAYPSILKRSPIPGPILDLGIYVGLLLSFFLILLIYFPQSIRRTVQAFLEISLFKGMREKRQVQSFFEKAFLELDEFKVSMDQLMRSEVKGILMVILITVFYWVLFFSIPSVLLLGLGKDPFWGEVIVVQTVLHLILLYIPTPGKSGVVEFGFASFFSFFASSGLSGILTVVWRFLTYFLLLLAGGLLSLRYLIKNHI